MRSLLLLFAVFIVAMPSCLCKDTGKSISNGAKIANNKRNVQLKEGYKIFEEHIKLQQLWPPLPTPSAQLLDFWSDRMLFFYINCNLYISFKNSCLNVMRSRITEENVKMVAMRTK